MSNSWVPSFPSMGFPGGTTVGGGGDGPITPRPRDPLDAQRMAAGFAPGASYPDGYLGNITDRHQDKMYGVLQKRLTDRSYQRGVHKGERLGQDSYFWTADVNPDLGIERQMQTAALADNDGGLVINTARYAPTGNPVERLAHMGKTAGLTPPEQMQMSRQYGVDPARNPMPMTMTDPTRAAQMSRSLPRWSGVFNGN